MQEIIRTGQAPDASCLAAFNIAMAWETEQTRLNPATVEAGVRSLLENPANGFYLVVERDRKIVACLMVTFEWSDWRNGSFWWVQSVYVLPAYRRQKLFTRLYEKVKSLAKSRDDVCGLRLYVEQNNTSAQATYKSLGMDQTPYAMYEVEFAGHRRK